MSSRLLRIYPSIYDIGVFYHKKKKRLCRFRLPCLFKSLVDFFKSAAEYLVFLIAEGSEYFLLH